MNFIDKKDNIVAFYFFKLPWFKKIKNIHANIYGIGEYVSYSLFFLNFHLWTTKNLELTNPEFLSKKLEKLLNQFNQKQWK
ncbi:hypothetical protein ACD574_02875 [Campylobacter sp. LH-2024]|uniref:hypothetical protein n=1 Tax=Campylobacter sp. LH-2024 TaxID=3239825 RepID=UPI003B81B845